MAGINLIKISYALISARLPLDTLPSEGKRSGSNNDGNNNNKVNNENEIIVMMMVIKMI